MHFFKKNYINKQAFYASKTILQLQKKHIPYAEIETELLQLHHSLDDNDIDGAYLHAKSLEKSLRQYNKKPFVKKFLEIAATLCIAIAAAAIIRQTCFELYEVPTGSMRPTIKEKDRVFVSKLTYGINVPFTPTHVLFSKSRVSRGDVVVVTSENLDLSDTDTLYFSVFPGKKRYTKRLVALPGDSVYFYGGDLFITPAGEETVLSLKHDPSIPNREYIPFISSFEGRVEKQPKTPFSRDTVYLLKHFNIPIGKIELSPSGNIISTIPSKGNWIEEFSEDQKDEEPRCFGEFFGINNYGICKILFPQDLPKIATKLGYADEKAVLYIEVQHNPTLPDSKYILKTKIPLIHTNRTWIPLHEEHLPTLLEGLYTARFDIKDNSVSKYYFEPHSGTKVRLPHAVPDGTYEFFNGKAYKVGLGGHTTLLPSSHPIYPKSIEELAFWINYGIDFSEAAANPQTSQYPTRFVYFNEGNLLVMGQIILQKDDPVLQRLAAQETGRQAKDYAYFAFQDSHGEENAEITPALIRQYGLKIPEKQYLLLGDNPAMSLDCRYFGMVPEENLQGTAVLIFWPFSERFGFPTQPYKLPSFYTVCALFLAILGIAAYYKHRANVIANVRHLLSQKTTIFKDVQER